MTADTLSAPARRRALLPWIGVGVFLLLVGGLAASLLGGSGVRDPMVGQPAPDIPAPRVAGASAEGAYLVNFWGTWCVPCRVEHPILMRMADEGAHIVGVAYRDDPQAVAAYLERHGNPFSALHLDEDGSTLPLWGVRGVPETFFVGEDGVITERVTGALGE